MIQLSSKSQKTLDTLKLKADNSNARMPSITSIHTLLKEIGISHDFDGETTNTVERRSAGKRYVNERHDGKVGKKIEIESTLTDGSRFWLEMDSSDSYYSWNTYRYARELLKIIESKTK